MVHRNLEAMVDNTCNAIPPPWEEGKSVNTIFNTQDKPRLPRGEIEALCKDMVADGEMEEIACGYARYYRWYYL